MRVLLGDATGVVRAEVVDGTISEVTWRLNAAGSATVTVARGSAAFRQELLEPSARVYVEFDNGLPAWGGVLDTPRSWEPGVVSMKAYTIERILSYRTTKKTRSFSGMVVGGIFTRILEEVEERYSIGLTVGSVWMGGAVHYPRYHFRDAMWIINSSLRKMENCDYRFTPYLDGNRILFRAELQQMMGDDKRARVALMEGANLAEPSLSEQGTIINRVAIVGSGATWAEREVVWGVEEASRARFGLRESMFAPADVSQELTLARYADTLIKQNAFPHAVASFTAADVAPARFADYDVGDIVRVVMPSLGFSGYDAATRITARGFDPGSGRCEVVCDEAFEPSPILEMEDEGDPE
jgi:hypothetical protein